MSAVMRSRTGSSLKPGANTNTSTGAPTTPSRLISDITTMKLPPMTATNSRIASIGPRLRYPASTGTNACENAPSANSRRKKFGIRNATKNASAAGVAPKKYDNTMSRTSPEMRDRNVMLATMLPWRPRFCVCCAGGPSSNAELIVADPSAVEPSRAVPSSSGRLVDTNPSQRHIVALHFFPNPSRRPAWPIVHPPANARGKAKNAAVRMRASVRW